MSAVPAEARISVAGLFEDLADGVYTLAFRLLWDRHLAEDVVQETFLAALRNLASYRGEGPIAAWLYRIAYRRAIAALRKRREVPTEPAEILLRAEQASPLAPSVEQQVITRELMQQLERAIDALPNPLRATFVLRDIEGLSTKEVAASLGIGASAVKMRLTRARKQLRVMLREVLDDL